nr:hypothetical protein [Butyrivibrio sp.]
DYDIKDICELMGVSRSGYYKWKNRKKSERDIKREELIALVDLVHADHKTHGYRWTAAFIRLEYGYECSDNYVYKCFRFLGIKSETKHQVHPCYAIGYGTPVNYRKRYFKGELEKKNTFEKRVLSEEPKFVQKRRKQAHSGDVSTFEKERV